MFTWGLLRLNLSPAAAKDRRERQYRPAAAAAAAGDELDDTMDWEGERRMRRLAD